MMKKTITHNISKEIAIRSAGLARRLTGWRQWLIAALAAVAGAIAWFTQSADSAAAEDITPSGHPDTQVPAP